MEAPPVYRRVMEAIHTTKLTKVFDRQTAVDALDLSVNRGEVFGFLGPNGAGKSTTIRMLIGLLRPTSGSAVVAGYDVGTEPLEAKKRIGYMAENPYAYDKLTGREFLAFVADLYQTPKDAALERSMTLMKLLDLLDDADKIVEGYSRGMRQKLGLISALLHEPEVLFLDEPTSGLDPRSARTVKDLLTELARRGKTVFMSTHVLEIAEHMCDRVGIINHGKLVAQGSLAELRAGGRSDASLEDIFLELTGGEDTAEIAKFLAEN
jgi:ABC-2 type transport system ATP-binding protein